MSCLLDYEGVSSMRPYLQHQILVRLKAQDEDRF